MARGHHRPDSILELKLLLRTAFESPVHEQRARSELLNLQQRSGENASTYMARTRALLHKVPGYDEKTVLQQWLLGLRQPYRLEAKELMRQTKESHPDFKYFYGVKKSGTLTANGDSTRPPTCTLDRGYR